MRKLDLDISKLPMGDRIIGFTIPHDGRFYVCDHDEVWEVAIAATPNVKVNYNVAGRTGQIQSRTLSGEWFAASF